MAALVIESPAAESYSLAGFEFELECCESRIARQFRRTFLPFAGAEASAAHRYVVDSDGERFRLWFDEESVRVDASWEWLYAYLEWHAVQRALGTAEGFVALHAAALSRNDGALLLSGPSGAGKSTLTLELLRYGGWGYMSDEAVLLTGEGVRGFPRAIVLKADPDAGPDGGDGDRRAAVLSSVGGLGGGGDGGGGASGGGAAGGDGEADDAGADVRGSGVSASIGASVRV